MVGQYPHKLYFKPGEPAAPIQDQVSGDWVKAEGDDNRIERRCRAEMNGNNRTVILGDGAKLEYSFVIYLPKGSGRIEKDTMIQVIGGDGFTLCTAPVKQYQVGQLNCKLYV